MRAIVFFSITDVLTFFLAVSVLGIAAEGNPFSRGIFVAYGLLGIIALKTVPVLGVALARGRVGPLNWRVLWIWVVGLGVVGTISNTASFFINARPLA